MESSRLRTDLRAVLEAVLADYDGACADQGLTIEQDLPDYPVWIHGDENRLVHVFDQLLANTLALTEPPEVISAALRRDDGRAITRIGNGPSRAAEFIVRLPLVEHARLTPGHLFTQPRRPRRHVLLVEDNEDTSQMLSDLLRVNGHRVSCVAAVADALRALQLDPPDIVLCDIGLPGPSGFALARAVRRDPRLENLPLVAITGYAQREDRRRSQEAGFDVHLTKPVVLDVLTEVVEMLTEP